MLKLERWLEFYLPGQPEYRMGYQKVIATLNSGGTEAGIIVNSQVFLKEGETSWQMGYNWDFILAEAAKSQLLVERVVLIPREPETLRGVRQVAITNEKFHQLSNRIRLSANSAYGSVRTAMMAESQELAIKAASAAAEDAPITLTASGEVFKRFSPWVNDNRITSGKGVTPGTFATTKEDADAHIKTGTDATARYALPSPKPASNVFTLSPASDTDLKRGVTQPANNQPGGGVEVIFVNGLPDGTVTGPATIPDK